MKAVSPARNAKSSRALSAKQFCGEVSAALLPVADPALRAGMRAYMKNQFEFLGVKTPSAARCRVEFIRAQQVMELQICYVVRRALWKLPEREYQYVAADLLACHVARLTPTHIPALLALVKKKSWWDTVDALAGVIGRVVRSGCADDSEAQRLMDEALGSPNLWTRRVAIIHQLGWRRETDSRRLFMYASTCSGEKDFFIRKAIGWALRDYARHAPAEVRAFLKANRTKLSPLTLREAGKHIV